MAQVKTEQEKKAELAESQQRATKLEERTGCVPHQPQHRIGQVVRSTARSNGGNGYYFISWKMMISLGSSRRKEHDMPRRHSGNGGR